RPGGPDFPPLLARRFGGAPRGCASGLETAVEAWGVWPGGSRPGVSQDMCAQSQSGTRTGRRYLCLHTPHLRTDRVRRDGDPAAVDRPIVLTRRVGGSLVVEAACPAAAARGVAAG